MAATGSQTTRDAAIAAADKAVDRNIRRWPGFSIPRAGMASRAEVSRSCRTRATTRP